MTRGSHDTTPWMCGCTTKIQSSKGRAIATKARHRTIPSKLVQRHGQLADVSLPKKASVDTFVPLWLLQQQQHSSSSNISSSSSTSRTQTSSSPNMCWRSKGDSTSRCKTDCEKPGANRSMQAKTRSATLSLKFASDHDSAGFFR